MKDHNLRFPIGVFKKPEKITDVILEEWIAVISTFPSELSSEIHLLSNTELDTPYRPDGWTIRQVVHHFADSHMNSYIRIKLALTEDQPIIKPYFEERWAELPDSKHLSVLPSLKIIEGVHERWVVLLKSLTDDQFKMMFIHPEHGKTFSLDEVTGFYAWHCRHHLAHIFQAKKNFQNRNIN